MKFRKMLAIAIAMAAIGCGAISVNLAAATVPDTAPIITYKATGVFADSPTSGEDQLKLAGEPFGVSIAVSAATPPSKSGPNYDVYKGLDLLATVHSLLVGTTGVHLSSKQAVIIQTIVPTKYDSFVMEAPVRVPVVGVNLTIKATILMPLGTISKPLLHPFKTIYLRPSNAKVSYTDGTNTTVLAIKTGKLTATIP